MSRLEKISKYHENQTKSLRKTTEDAKSPSVPVYSYKGYVKPPEKRNKQKKILLAVIIIIVIAAFLYVPQFFLKEENGMQEVSDIKIDGSAVSSMTTVLRENKSDDFDGDGLLNSEEEKYGTDIWGIDTDMDGATDYCEIYVSKTNPVVYEDVLLDAQKRQDEISDSGLRTPYKINNVILWADDYTSKAYGSVVETLKGYHICGFEGYAQFSMYPNWYAYKYKNGKHTLLPYREEEDVWKVSDDDYVELFQEPLEEVIHLEVFDKSINLSLNTVTKLLDYILPAKGFITAEKTTVKDLEVDTSEIKTADIRLPSFLTTDLSRFKANTRTMNDLMYVYEKIANNYCVAVSFYRENVGESIGIIYGYTGNGDLLVADTDTLEHIGIIKIYPMASKMLDNNGLIVSDIYFNFEAFGFSSESGDRISFFASTDPSDKPVEETEVEELFEEETTRIEETTEAKEENTTTDNDASEETSTTDEETTEEADSK